MNALTACSEEPVSYDPACRACYDPLEQAHSPCPTGLTVPSTEALPAACQPYACSHREHQETETAAAPVLLRDYQQKLDLC